MMESMDVDSDEEKHLEDIQKINAALEEDDEPSLFLGPSVSGSMISRLSRSILSTSTDEIVQEHVRIDSALGLNKLLDEKLRRLEKVLVDRLHECRQKLSELQEFVPGEKQERHETFRYVSCGKPYFKDKSNFPAPDNEDTVLMAKSNMYDFSEITSVPGWTVKDKCSLTNLLLKMSIEIRKKELNSEIAKLKREGKDTKPKILEKQIDAINREITGLAKKTLKDVALPIDQEYDWDIVANKLNKRHSASEYRSLWKVFLHPSINKSIWDKNEHARLHEIAHKHHLQDWDAIAKELNTGRTGYQCFVYYRTNMSNTFSGKKWTKEEEEYLRRLIEYYKEDEYIPWGKVASSMENRTKIQIYNKYFRLVEKRKGRFLPEEDAVILTCVDKFGTNFKKMSGYLPGRSATQIRIRYQVLVKMRISTVWTEDEDKRLLQFMANEPNITNYSAVTKWFPGKTRVHIRARYLTLIKWMKRYPNASLANAPRRGARRLGHGLATDNLNKATERLKKRIETEIQKRKSKRITKESPLEVIEDAIIANLATEAIREQEEKREELYDEEDIMAVDTESMTSVHKLNVTNIQKMIIFLKGKLNKELFKNSPYAEEYPGLLDPKLEVNLFKVKSYSRKAATTSIQVKSAPDIWGNNTLKGSAYFLPPHYATLTGLRKMITYINATKDAPPTNISNLIRKNPILKDQFFLLLERFNSLFLFPILLSNEGPERLGKRIQEIRKDADSMNTSMALKEILDNFALSGPAQSISNTCIAKGKAKAIAEAEAASKDMSIDLEEPDEDQKNKICVQKVIVDENRFRLVAEGEGKNKRKNTSYICC